MTSRISSVKLIKEELGHHIVSIFAAVLVFLAEILLFYFEILRVLQPDYARRYANEVVAAAGEPNFPALIPMIVLAVLLSMEYFDYLHSQRKTDFYMSLPLKRKEQLYLGVAVCGIIFVTPCILATGCECLIGYASGHGTVLFLQNMLWSFICKLLTFLACFLSMTLAMIMTGNRVVAFMGFSVFSAYVPFFIKNLIPSFEQLFFDTYAGVNDFADSWDYFSPVAVAYGLVRDYENWTLARHLNYLIAILIFIFIVGVLTQILYVKRPAEAAGRAMAFPKANSTIRFLIVIPLALYCGYFLQQTSPDGAYVWLFIGTVIGVVLLHGIIESIFRFDLRGMLKKKKQLGASVLVCVAFILVFQMDLMKYDEYVPETDEVKSVEILPETDGIYFYKSIYTSEKEGIHGEGIKDVVELAQILVEQNKIFENQVDNQYDEYNDIGLVTIKYQMKNGSVKAREYYMGLENEEVKNLLNKICATEEFKDDYHTLYNVKSEDIMKITLDNAINVESLMFSEEKQREFIEIYRKELTELTITDMEEKNKIARFSVAYNKSVEAEYAMDETYDIYEHFDNTIDFLAENGIILESPFLDCTILSVELYEEYYGDTIEKPAFRVDDSELLEEVKEEFILVDLYDQGYVTSVKDCRYGTAEILINNKTNYYDIYLRENTVKKLEAAAKYDIVE